jgi:hypothetical protein
VIVSLPAELVFLIGVACFALALIFYSLILKRLLVIIRRPSWIWFLPVLGAILLGLALIFHFLPLPYYPHLDPSRTEVILTILLERTLEASFLLLAGISALVAALVYFGWVSKR